jgi:hypothetical protein
LHDHLRGLATAIHEKSGLGQGGFFLQKAGEAATIDRLFLYLAFCLHAKGSEHIAPIMFPPFSLSPIGLSVVEPMGIFFTNSTI